METKIYHVLPDDAKKIREEVFVREQGFCEEYDATDGIATHIVVFKAGEPVATCRIFKGDNPKSYVLGRLAVRKQFRGTGIGTYVLAQAEKCAASAGAENLMLHSQLHAKGFYEKSGYIGYGEIEYEQDCPHIWMKKELV